MALIERNTAYSLNDIVNTKYGTKLKCTTAGTTSTDPLILDGTSPITDGTVVWEVQEEGTGHGLVDYEDNKSYNVGDIVIYDNIIYKCAIAHTSTAAFDESKWVCISGGEISNGMEIVDLWEGSFSFDNNTNGSAPTSSTPMIELSESIMNFDYIIVTYGLTGGTDYNSNVFSIKNANYATSSKIRMSLSGNSPYYARGALAIYDSTHLYIIDAGKSGWPSGLVTNIKGIRKAKPIVSSGMKYETLWEGEAGSYSGSGSTTISLSDNVSKYQKIGFTIKTKPASESVLYYREIDVDNYIKFIDGTLSVDHIGFYEGYSDFNDYVEINAGSTSTQVFFSYGKSLLIKVVGISEGVQIPTGVQAARVTLWEGTKTGNDSSNVQLLDNISNYDVLEIESCIAWNADGTSKNGYMSGLFEVNTILENPTSYISVSNFLNSVYNYSMDVTFPDNTYFKIQSFSKGSSLVTADIIKITGIKYIQPDSYSTEEKLIGTWIDGKPLYRKVFTPTGSGTSLIFESGLVGANYSVQKIYATVSDTINNIITIPFNDGVTRFTIYISYSTGTVHIETNQTNYTVKSVIIEYTKN